MKYLKRFNESVDNYSIEELCKKYLDTEKNKNVKYEIQNGEVVIANDSVSLQLDLLNTFLTPDSSRYYDITEESHHWFEILSEYDPIRPGRELILDLFNGFLEEIGKEPLNEKQLNNLKYYWKLI